DPPPKRRVTIVLKATRGCEPRHSSRGKSCLRPYFLSVKSEGCWIFSPGSGPRRGEPRRGEPQRGGPHGGVPRQCAPQRGGPQLGAPRRGEPQWGGPQRG